MSDRPDVLVVGAGPTGLTTALQAIAHGARVRIIERRPEAFRPSRALIVHPRTLEVLRPLGVTDALLARADTAPRARVYLGARRVPITLTRLDLPDTAFPHLTLLRQADAEAALDHALAERGVAVERGTRLVDLRQTAEGPCARLHTGAGTEQVACATVVGCDGVESTIRRGLGIGWPGGTYRREVLLADLELADDGVGALEPGMAHVVAGRRGLVFLFALGERATWRMLATRPVGGDVPPGPPGAALPTAELQQLIDDAGLPARISQVPWSTRVRLQHRIADAYQRGMIFLAGDAAHAASPAGGTGMNTGIQDAVNLGWKLALATSSSAPAELLATYEAERRPAARQTLALTHLIFWGESSTDPLACLLRGTLAPLLAPALPYVMRRRRLLAEGVRQLSQLQVNYRRSPLSVDGGSLHHDLPRAGDRLPDATVTCGPRRGRLHELLATPGVHLLLDRDAPSLPPGIAGPHLHVHRLTSSPGTAVTAVRPDGYVGYKSHQANEPALRRWLHRVGAVQPD